MKTVYESSALVEKNIELISDQFQLSREEIFRQSLLAFLEKKLREVQSQILQISGKYGIHTIYEFEELYKQGKLEEKGSFEDFQKFDHLEFKRDSLQKMIKELR